MLDLAPRSARVIWSFVAAVVLTLGVPAIVRAATIYPNVTGDSASGSSNCSDSNPPVPANGSEECSLRQAVAFAKSGDVISLAAPAPTSGYSLEKELPIAGKEIAIVGAGQAVTAAKTGFRLFSIAPSGTATIEDLALENGQAEQGGAILDEGTLVVRDDMIVHNGAPAGPSSVGGAIENMKGASLTVLASTLSENEAHEGGAIDSEGKLAIVNSTITENTAVDGGGVFVAATPEASTIANATIAGNKATRGGNLDLAGGPVQVKNSIVAGGTATEGKDCFLLTADLLESKGYNLSDAAINGECELDGTGDREAVGDIDVGPLRANGGPTLTRALEPGSAAIAAGNPAGCSDESEQALGTDQRGVARPRRCDVGAYQTPVADLDVSVSVAATVIESQPFTYTVTITNSGPANAEGVTVTDELPAGATLVSAPGCSGTTTLTCSIGSVAAGGQASVSVTVEQVQLGVASNSAEVTSAARDPEPANNSASASTAVEPALPSGVAAAPSGPSPAPASPTGAPPSAGNLIMAFKQKLRSTLSAYFLCKVTSCKVTISGTIRVGKRSIAVALKPVTITADQKRKLTIRLSKKLRLELAKALTKHQKVTLAVAASVRYEGVIAKTRTLTSTLER